MGCRFPGGVRGPEDLWRLVREGADAISTAPTNRGWDLAELYDADPDAPGAVTTRHGGLLDDVAGFDAEFFGVAPPEAPPMDPQQRVVLETAWEAGGHGPLRPRAVEGAHTGGCAG